MQIKSLMFSGWVSCLILNSVLSGCTNSEAPILPNPPPTANFKYTLTDSMGRTAASFTNTSINAVGYRWDFGDGGISFSKNPFHFYDCIGQYQVQLIAYGYNSYPDHSIHRDSIKSMTKPVLKITKISILQMPFTDASGRYWDSKYVDEDQGRPKEDGSVWPDIAFTVENPCWHLKGDSVIYELQPTDLPAVFELQSPQLELPERQPTLLISIYDLDDGFQKNLIGSISFTVYPLVNASSFPTYITYENASSELKIGLNLKWL